MVCRSADQITVVVAGGGFGGHVYSAIAVAQRLRRDPKVKRVCYIGTPDGIEKDIAESADLEFFPIVSAGMPRRWTLALVPWALQTGWAVETSLRHLLRLRPDVVFATGAFASGPVLIAATLLRIPFVIHDADAFPGKVSRAMAPFARAVSVAFEAARLNLHSQRIVLCGNPVRADFGAIQRSEAMARTGLDPQRKTVLALGGAHGSPVINDAMLGAARSLVEDHHLQVIHQTGKANFEDCRRIAEQRWPAHACCRHYRLVPYLEQSQVAIAAADLAISRSGALSIAEFNLLGVPAILVPWTLAAADHQTTNACALEREGAAIHLSESRCTPECLASLIAELIGDSARLAHMSRNARRLARPDATERVAQLVRDIARQGQGSGARRRFRVSAE